MRTGQATTWCIVINVIKVLMFMIRIPPWVQPSINAIVILAHFVPRSQLLLWVMLWCQSPAGLENTPHGFNRLSLINYTSVITALVWWPSSCYVNGCGGQYESTTFVAQYTEWCFRTNPQTTMLLFVEANECQLHVSLTAAVTAGPVVPEVVFSGDEKHFL